jgi:hypothetical protein
MIGGSFESKDLGYLGRQFQKRIRVPVGSSKGFQRANVAFLIITWFAWLLAGHKNVS